MDNPPARLTDDLSCLLGLLAVRGAGRAPFRRAASALLLAGQSPAEALERLSRDPDLKQVAAVARAVVADGEALATWRAMNELGLRIVVLGSRDYPDSLAQIPDPALALFVRGQLEDSPRRVAVVGSRRCSAVSDRLANDLAERLVRRNLCIVSGLAEGVDGSAHRGALMGGGSTLAVLGHGLRHCFPGWHRRLAEQIVAAGGALISEYPPEWRPRPHQFPERNRLISGLVEAVVVVEASARSGSLITARLALEQGREVLAVPGSVDGGSHRGCHRLLKDGAALVETAEDVLAALGIPAEDEAESSGADAALTSAERGLLSHLTARPATVDALADAAGEPASAVLSLLCDLELKGFVRAFGGGYIRRPFST